MRASRFACLLVSGCLSRSAPSSETSSCSNDARVPPPAAIRTIEGYPTPRVTLTAAEIDARRAELEARVPGWQVTVSPSGNVMRVETAEAVGMRERPISAERVRRVKAALVALGFATENSSTLVRRDHQEMVEVDETYVGRQEAIDPTSEQVHLLITFTDAPALPPGVRELTDDELHAQWGAGWQKRQVSVFAHIEGRPCDMVRGHENACAGAGPRTERRCTPLEKLEVERRVSEGPEGFRHLYGVRAFDQSFGGTLSYDAPVSLCLDAVTGEGLPLERCLLIPEVRPAASP